MDVSLPEEPRCEYCGWKLDAAHASGCPVESAERDLTPWCLGCGAMKQQDCDCGPIVEGN